MHADVLFILVYAMLHNRIDSKIPLADELTTYNGLHVNATVAVVHTFDVRSLNTTLLLPEFSFFFFKINTICMFRTKKKNRFQFRNRITSTFSNHF